MSKAVDSTAREPGVWERFGLHAEERQREDEARMAWLNLKEAEQRLQKARRRTKRNAQTDETTAP